MAKRTEALSAEHREALLAILHERFEANMQRHEGIAWSDVRARLEAHPAKLRSLSEMERTGGEPDVVSLDPKTREYVFYDCSSQSPQGRRSMCYDREAQEEREKKGVHPAGNVIDTTAGMGIELLSEAEYRALQELGEFDTKTSSWIETPQDIRDRGGALFADRRYGTVFVYHNSAPSFYSARGFRGSLRV